MTPTMTWTPSEIHYGGVSTEHEGWTADVWPHSDGSWFWRVDATAAVSEWPEIYNFGMTDTMDEAVFLAEAALDRAHASVRRTA